MGNGKCSVKIKVTFNRKRKYFATGVDVTPDEFEQIFYGKRKNPKQKEIKNRIEYFESKADDVIKALKVFSFDAFKEHYLDERNTTDSVSFAFDKYIESLKVEKRIGTAVSYECAKNSISSFNKNLTFADITPNFLKKYENWMLENRNSISTVGIYLRSLRAVYNKQKIDKTAYPFGKEKYTIPTSENTKKALTIDEVGKIFHFEIEPNRTKEMARDYWIFLYLCNGMNVKDFCLLKWSNISDNIIRYSRAKTKRSQKKQKKKTGAPKPQNLEKKKKKKKKS